MILIGKVLSRGRYIIIKITAFSNYLILVYGLAIVVTAYQMQPLPVQEYLDMILTSAASPSKMLCLCGAFMVAQSIVGLVGLCCKNALGRFLEKLHYCSLIFTLLINVLVVILGAIAANHVTAENLEQLGLSTLGGDGAEGVQQSTLGGIVVPPEELVAIIKESWYLFLVVGCTICGILFLALWGSHWLSKNMKKSQSTDQALKSAQADSIEAKTAKNKGKVKKALSKTCPTCNGDGVVADDKKMSKADKRAEKLEADEMVEKQLDASDEKAEGENDVDGSNQGLEPEAEPELIDGSSPTTFDVEQGVSKKDTKAALKKAKKAEKKATNLLKKQGKSSGSEKGSAADAGDEAEEMNIEYNPLAVTSVAASVVGGGILDTDVVAEEMLGQETNATDVQDQKGTSTGLPPLTGAALVSAGVAWRAELEGSCSTMALQVHPSQPLPPFIDWTECSVWRVVHGELSLRLLLVYAAAVRGESLARCSVGYHCRGIACGEPGQMAIALAFCLSSHLFIRQWTFLHAETKDADGDSSTAGAGAGRGGEGRGQ